MAKVILTFEVDTNQALLLMTFHDLITGTEPDDSNAILDCFAWLLDEIGGRVDNVVPFIHYDGGTLSWQAWKFAELYGLEMHPSVLDELRAHYPDYSAQANALRAKFHAAEDNKHDSIFRSPI